MDEKKKPTVLGFACEGVGGHCRLIDEAAPEFEKILKEVDEEIANRDRIMGYPLHPKAINYENKKRKAPK